MPPGHAAFRRKRLQGEQPSALAYRGTGIVFVFCRAGLKS
jgi:hypothetical protein